MKKSVMYIVRSGVIAALYIALTMLFIPISYGIVQFRISEVLTVMPFFMPDAVAGLFVGCLVSNILGGATLLDIILGSLATLAAAYATYRIKNRYLAPLPPVIINAAVVGLVLAIQYGQPYTMAAGSVLLGQAVVCYGGGLPLITLLEAVKFKDRLKLR